MARLLSTLAWSAVLAVGCAAARGAERPPVDAQAMHEAMSGGGEERFASSRAYFYFTRARLYGYQGLHRASADDLRLAEVYDPDAPAIRVALAEQLERLGELGKAEDELRRAAARSPGDEATQLALGRILAEEKKPEQAATPLKRAIRIAPADPAPAIALAQVYLDLGREERAFRCIEALGKSAPNEAAGYKYLGQVMADGGQLKKAEKLLLEAKARNPADVETLQLLARIDEDENRLPEAAAEYEEALSNDPEEPNVLLASGSLALRRGDAATAKAYFDQLLSVMPDDLDVKVKVAFAWFGARHLDEAAALLDEARVSLPGDPRLAFYAGLIHEEQRAYDKAAEAFSAVDRSADLYPEAELHLGTCLSLAGHHKDAVEQLRRSLVEHPDSRALQVALADAYARDGRLQQALDLLTEAAQAHHSDELYAALADLYERAGRGPEAVAVLAQALQARPDDLKLRYALALAYEKGGEVDRAVEAMRKVLALDPENANALNFIAYTFADHGQNLEEAERLVKRALQIRPDSGAFTDSLGWVYFKRGDFRMAVETLQHAETLAPDEAVIIEHLGDALSKARRKLDAADAYRRALKALEGDPDRAVHDEIERKLKLIDVQQAGN